MTGKRLALQSRARPTDPGICVLEAGVSARVEAIHSFHIKQNKNKNHFTQKRCTYLRSSADRERAGVGASN